jgi:glycine cleavage system H protein
MIPEDLRYTADHEWVRLDEDGCVTVGITHHAQSLLGDVVFVQLPEAGREVVAGEPCAEVESIKSVAEVYAPIAGAIEATNPALEAGPELLNDSPYGDGWLLRVRPAETGALDALLSATGYQELITAAEG